MVELRGVLDTIWRFGPPNFGDEPDTDSRVLVSVLKLASPVDVLADSTSELNRQDLQGIDVVQLVAANDALWAKLLGSSVTVTGSLFQAQTGHHYTPVLINVTGVTATPAP